MSGLCRSNDWILGNSERKCSSYSIIDGGEKSKQQIETTEIINSHILAKTRECLCLASAMSEQDGGIRTHVGGNEQGGPDQLGTMVVTLFIYDPVLSCICCRTHTSLGATNARIALSGGGTLFTRCTPHWKILLSPILPQFSEFILRTVKFAKKLIATTSTLRAEGLSSCYKYQQTVCPLPVRCSATTSLGAIVVSAVT